MVTITDPIGRETEYRFLDSKRQDVISEKDGNMVVRQYDKDWRLRQISSLKDGVTSFTRDERGRVTGILDSRNRLTQIRYDNALGLPSTVIDDRGLVRKFRYDAHGRLICYRKPDGKKLSARYNRFGLPLWMQDSDGRTTRFEYDGAGGLEAVKAELGGGNGPAKVRQGKSLSGFLKRPAFRNLPVPEPRRRLARLLDRAVITADGPRVKVLRINDQGDWTCAYDLFGNLVSVKEDGGEETALRYDAVDKLMEIQYAGLDKESFEYDDADRVIRYVDPGGDVWFYEYDPQGNLRKEALPGGEVNVFDYNAEGHVVSAYNSFWHDLYSYDSCGRVVKAGRLTPFSKGAETLVAYTYDNKGRLETVLFPNGVRVTHEYHKPGTTETVMFMNKKIVIQYDRRGRPETVLFPGGIKEEYAYSEGGTLSRVGLRGAGGKMLMSQFCEYRDGRLCKVFSRAPERDGQYSFTYTADGVLKGVLFNGRAIGGTNGKGLKKSFDALGRLRLTGKKNTITEYSYGSRGVVSVNTSGAEIYIVRSSDGAPRALIQNGQVKFLVKGAVQGEAFVVDPLGMKVRPIAFRDTARPNITIVKKGDLL